MFVCVPLIKRYIMKSLLLQLLKKSFFSSTAMHPFWTPCAQFILSPQSSSWEGRGGWAVTRRCTSQSPPPAASVFFLLAHPTDARALTARHNLVTRALHTVLLVTKGSAETWFIPLFLSCCRIQVSITSLTNLLLLLFQARWPEKLGKACHAGKAWKSVSC